MEMRASAIQDMIDVIIDMYPDEKFLTVDGFEDCLIGVAERFGGLLTLAYDKDKILKKMMDRDGMTWEDAEEYFDYNIVGAWVGDKTPIFISKEF